MLDMTSITTAFSAIKAAKDLGTALVELRDFKNMASMATDLNNKLLQAQESLFALQSKLFELHTEKEEVLKKLAKLEEAATQRACYKLVELATGVFTYRLKLAEDRPNGIFEDDEPIHYLCQSCLDIHGQRSILARFTSMYGQVYLDCAMCKRRFDIAAQLPTMGFRSEF